MFSQGVLGRMVRSGAIQAGNLLREAAVCPVAASEPLNCNLLVLQRHGQTPTGEHSAGDNWKQTGPYVEQSQENNKVLQGQAETLWPYRAMAPTSDPTATSDTRQGISKELPMQPLLPTDLSLWNEACSWTQVAVGKKCETSHSISKSPPLCLHVSW